MHLVDAALAAGVEGENAGILFVVGGKVAMRLDLLEGAAGAEVVKDCGLVFVCCLFWRRVDGPGGDVAEDATRRRFGWTGVRRH